MDFLKKTAVLSFLIVLCSCSGDNNKKSGTEEEVNLYSLSNFTGKWCHKFTEEEKSETALGKKTVIEDLTGLSFGSSEFSYDAMLIKKFLDTENISIKQDEEGNNYVLVVLGFEILNNRMFVHHRKYPLEEKTYTYKDAINGKNRSGTGYEAKRMRNEISYFSSEVFMKTEDENDCCSSSYIFFDDSRYNIEFSKDNKTVKLAPIGKVSSYLLLEGVEFSNNVRAYIRCD